MSKNSMLFLLPLLMCLLLLSSCGVGGLAVSEERIADARMEQIISAIKEKDGEALKSLF